MFEALQSDGISSVTDLLSQLLQSVDTDGDGTISADELQAVIKFTTGQLRQDNRLSTGTDRTGDGAVPLGAFVLLEGNPGRFSPGDLAKASGTTSKRYTDLLQSLAKAA